MDLNFMAADRALTRVVAYSAAKAAIDNLTRWLAVEFAQRYGAGVRVNAIAPGFLVGEQNRHLLLEESGEPTARGRKILRHTPMARFGEPEELVGAAVWLARDASRFVTGVGLPVDGGFSAQGGVQPGLIDPSVVGSSGHRAPRCESVDPGRPRGWGSGSHGPCG